MSRRVAVVGVSRAGAELACRLARVMPGGEAFVHSPKEPVANMLPRLFRDPSVDGLVVVLAVGATVRLLAPWLRGKAVDPAVVVVDDAGQYAVALVSGHRGGANALARAVAGAIGATPVVTTASEASGLLAVDLLGAEEGWRIEAEPDALRRAAAAVVNRLPVGFFQDAGTAVDPGPGVRLLSSLDDPAMPDLAALLVVTDRHVPMLMPAQVVYRPPTLVAGVGCSRGAACADILSAIELALEHGGLAKNSLACLATIDRRAREPGLLAAAEALEVPVRAFCAEALAEVGPLPTPSEAVRAAVGTPGVCEPAALLASGATSLLVPKVKTSRATAAIACVTDLSRGTP
jgi:cobalamin biosynthesis protein CbiG